MIDSHSHLHIGLSQTDTQLPVALMSGGIVHALLFDRHNELADQALKDYPQLKALAWATLSDLPQKSSPNKSMPGISEVNDVISYLKENSRFVGLKFHPTIDGVAFNDERVHSYLRELSKLVHPLGLKYSVLMHSAVNVSEASHIKEMANLFPNLNFIVGHMFIDRIPDKRMAVIALAREQANVFLETSWAPWEDIIKAIQLAGADKVLIGTDTMSADHYQKRDVDFDGLINFLRPRISPEDFTKIFSGNAQRLFGFGQTEPEDAAMSATGGIDLSSLNQSLAIKSLNGEGVIQFTDGQHAAQSIQGLVPHFLKVEAMTGVFLSH